MKSLIDKEEEWSGVRDHSNEGDEEHENTFQHKLKQRWGESGEWCRLPWWHCHGLCPGSAAQWGSYFAWYLWSTQTETGHWPGASRSVMSSQIKRVKPAADTQHAPTDCTNYIQYSRYPDLLWTERIVHCSVHVHCTLLLIKPPVTSSLYNNYNYSVKLKFDLNGTVKISCRLLYLQSCTLKNLKSET